MKPLTLMVPGEDGGVELEHFDDKPAVLERINELVASGVPGNAIECYQRLPIEVDVKVKFGRPAKTAATTKPPQYSLDEKTARVNAVEELVEQGEGVSAACGQVGLTKLQFYRWRSEIEHGTDPGNGPRVGSDGRVFRSTEEKLAIVTRIAEAVEGGAEVKAAAIAEGIRPSQYYQWIRLQ